MQSAPLPDDLLPATSENAAGTWVPADDVPNATPDITLQSDGTWFTSEGPVCSNGYWTIAGDGRVLATDVSTAAIRCTGEAPYWRRSPSLGLRRRGPRLLDADGSELDWLIRT